MAEVLIRHYLIGVVMFCLIVVSGISMLGIMKDKDPTFATSDKYSQFNESFNRLNDVTGAVNNIQAGITNEKGDPGLFGVLNNLIMSSWQSIKLFFLSFGIMNAAYSGLSAIFGIPAWITGLAGLLVTILIGFTIYSAIFQKEL